MQIRAARDFAQLSGIFSARKSEDFRTTKLYGRHPAK
jgi:hypothetical protein